MRDEPTMLSHKRNQNNNSLGETWARAIQQLPGNRRYLATNWATTLGPLGLTLILHGT
jgi:hypothetical protein